MKRICMGLACMAGLAGALAMWNWSPGAAMDVRAGGGDSPLAALLAGVSVAVASEPGFALQRHANMTVAVLAGARAAQDAVALPPRCLAVHRARTDSDALVPLRIGDAASTDPAVLRGGKYPLVVGPEEARYMPRLEVGGTLRPGGLRIKVLEVRSHGTMLSDRGLYRAMPPERLPGVQIAGFDRAALLLWRSDGQAGALADRALRIERIRHAGCEGGDALSVRLLRAEGAVAGPQTVLVFHAEGMVESVLAPGAHVFASSRSLDARGPLETKALFDDSLRHGLVREQGSRWAVAPRELLDVDDGDVPPEWAQAHAALAEEEARLTLRRLHRTAAGRAVRAALAAEAPRARAAIRVPDRQMSVRATLGNVPQTLLTGLPPAGWSAITVFPDFAGSWRQIDVPDERAGEPVTFELDLNLNTGPTAVWLMGQADSIRVEGARLLSRRAPCEWLRCAGDASLSPIQELHLAPLEHAGRTARISVSALRPALPARLREPPWRPRLSGVRSEAAAAVVDVTTADGIPLWSPDGPRTRAHELGLNSLLGLDARHADGLAPTLSSAGLSRARLTVDSRIQSAALAAADCVGMLGGRLTHDGHCEDARPPVRQRLGDEAQQRVVALLVMDDEGAILAAAGAPRPSGQTDVEDLAAFDARHPDRSPLRLWGWQHDGRTPQRPGSTFKLVQALALESAAQRRPDIDALIEGMNCDRIDGLAAARKAGFSSHSPHYPAPGEGSASRSMPVWNHRHHALDCRGDRFGLASALAGSPNTWFAWTGDLIDATAGEALAGQQPLDATALDALRPTVAVARRLGFGAALRLDGGLLPLHSRHGPYGALFATPSMLEPVFDSRMLWRQFIGLAATATPLQMARVAAAIASERVPTPYLIAEADGRPAHREFRALGVRTDRIREGMRGAIRHGTAAAAFRGSWLPAGLIEGLYGKTGTTPWSAGPGASHNTGWFVGWLEAGTVPRETRRLVFAAMVRGTDDTGGASAAPLVRAFIERLHAIGIDPREGEQP